MRLVSPLVFAGRRGILARDLGLLLLRSFVSSGLLLSFAQRCLSTHALRSSRVVSSGRLSVIAAALLYFEKTPGLPASRNKAAA